MMLIVSQPVRVCIALVTAVWTSLVCCCALAGHPSVSLASAPAAATAIPPEHSCCAGKPVAADPAQPGDPAQPADPASDSHTCDCGSHDRLVERHSAGEIITRSQALTAPALDLALLTWAGPAADPFTLSVRHAADAPPQPHCAHSLLDQHCQLTT